MEFGGNGKKNGRSHSPRAPGEDKVHHKTFCNWKIGPQKMSLSFVIFFMPWNLMGNFRMIQLIICVRCITDDIFLLEKIHTTSKAVPNIVLETKIVTLCVVLCMYRGTYIYNLYLLLYNILWKSKISSSNYRPQHYHSIHVSRI